MYRAAAISIIIMVTGMLATIILICSAATAPSDCTSATALDAIRFPPERAAICGLSGQATLARMAIKPGEHEYAKIACERVREVVP